jgi:hypothetical protein
LTITSLTIEFRKPGMHRLLIAAATAAFLAATVAPAFADDYPPCSRTVTDHCKVVAPSHRGHDHGRHHPKPKPKPHHGHK